MNEIFNAITVIIVTILLFSLVVLNLYNELSRNFKHFNNTYYSNKRIRRISYRILMLIVITCYTWILFYITPHVFYFIVDEFKVIF
jgi:ABC-type Fe3+ transport system permease subunit